MASPVFFRTVRREPPAGPMLTPGEHNRWDVQADQTPPFVSSRMRQSEVHCRPSRHWIVFFLAPGEAGGPNWESGDFLMARESIPRMRNTPRGRLSTVDDRRNIDVPPRIAYGSLVGDFDGVSPNGLD